MAYFIDNAIAVRIIYLLVTPFTEWDAYKDGTIDENGVALKKGGDITNRENWTMLHRLVARLKRILAKIPGGSSKIASYAAAYLLVREALEDKKEYANLEEMYVTLLESELDPYLLREVHMLMEEAPANVAGNVATVEKPLSMQKRIKRRAISPKNVEVVVDGNNSSELSGVATLSKSSTK